MCYEECSLCTVKVEKTLSFGHLKNDIPCYFDINETNVGHYETYLKYCENQVSY